ncbi:MAG: succinyl-diaminopimelate desuccinylase [Rickettsiales bacterium]
MRDVVALTKALIACPSVTPHTAGVYEVIEEFLKPLGFKALRHTFHEDGTDSVENIYLRYGTSAPNFCFAGHTDVVPVGDEAAWTTPPFHLEVKDGELIGRGAEDMKGAIAAFMIAAAHFVEKNPNPKGSISLLITQDEEGFAINGTKKMLAWLKERGEVLDVCVVGEPTNPDVLGEMVKIGRRGSVSFTLTVRGKQGHVAYPDRADNPIPRILNMLQALENTPLDTGTEYFQPSNLEIVSIDVGNTVYNVIPASVSAKFNVRFNDIHSSQSVEDWVRKQCAPFGEFDIIKRVTGEAFHTEHKALTDVVVKAVEDVTGQRPALSTTGGTSDARFIKDYCPVVEFGTTGRTAHMVDERVEVKTLEGLAKVYEQMLKNYFA